MGQTRHTGTARSQEVLIPSGSATLAGELSVPSGAEGIVLFAHGSGSRRRSPRNQFVARTIREAGVGTLLFDLLTREEEAVDIQTRHLRFDITLLARRLRSTTDWIRREGDTRHLRVGYFGSSTGGGAALKRSRGSRPSGSGVTYSLVHASRKSAEQKEDEDGREGRRTVCAPGLQMPAAGDGRLLQRPLRERTGGPHGQRMPLRTPGVPLKSARGRRLSLA